MNDYDLLSSDMSKPPFEKLKRHLPSSSNLTLNNNAILTSTLGKLLVRVSVSSKYKLPVSSSNWKSM